MNADEAMQGLSFAFSGYRGVHGKPCSSASIRVSSAFICVPTP
jgi:hypothetical protein